MKSPTPLFTAPLLCLLIAAVAATAAIANQPQPNEQQCPKVEIKGPSRQKGLKPITYRARIKDFPEDQRPVVKWTITGGEIIAGEGTESVKVQPNARLVKAVIVVENAPSGCELTATTSTEITGPLPNTPPQVAIAVSASSIIRPCPPNMTSECTPTPETVELTATASDADDDTVLYTWSVTGGRLTGEGRSVTWELTGVANGTYTATVEVQDGRGNSTSQSLTVSVAPCNDCRHDVAPCPTLSVSAPSEVVSGQSLTFTVSGPDQSDVTYNWSVTAGTITSGQGTSSIVVDTSGLVDQSVTAIVSLGSADPSCSANASATVNILSAPEPTLITGVVQDSNGVGLVGAQVTAVREGGTFTSQGLVGVEGRYTLRSLRTGKYSVTVTFPGHRPSTQTIELKDPGDQGLLNFTLQKNR